MTITNQDVFSNLIIIYLLFSISFLINWTRFKSRFPNFYPEDNFLSWTIILMITLFWIFALPFYAIKIFKKY